MFGRSRERCEHGGHDRFDFARRGGFGHPFFNRDEDGGFGHGHGHGGPFGRGGRFFEHGMLRLVILALVAEQPRHGYEIIKELEERTSGLYAPSAGVIYPTLTLLEETGDIEVQSTDGARKLYAVTEAGRATLAGNRKSIDAVFARFEAIRSAARPERDPRIMRAIDNFRTALAMKARSGNLSSEQVGALTRLLDETARKIEEI
jgi:DNA-binding PadR family transcriptional regulator